MRPRPALLVAAALVAVLCGGDTIATVVHGGAVSNKAVEAGGIRLPLQPPPPVPYSLIGATASGTWFTQCAFGPLWLLGSLAGPYPWPAEPIPGRPLDNRPLDWVPPPLP
jgi:hypothetical protein